MAGCQLSPPSYTQRRFLLLYLRLAGTKVHLPWRECFSLLRAKGLTCIPPVRQILVLVLRFDCEFVMTFQRHGTLATRGFFFLARRGKTFSADGRTHENEDLSKTGGKSTANNPITLNSILFSTNACISINEFLQE